LQIIWILLIGTIVSASLLKWGGVYTNLRSFYFDHGWAHFLVYAMAATLCMFAWKHKTAFVLAVGLFILSVGLQLLHWLIFRNAIDYFGIVVNLFGIIAGVLLGLNILVLRSRTKNNLATHNFNSTSR
jgi:hypothetical protein